MTIQKWLNQAKHKLESIGLASAKIDSELVLAYTLGQTQPYLHAHNNDTLLPETIGKAETLLERRMNNEPMAFILGEKEFFGLSFKTDKRALIPRWESELIVETANNWLSLQQVPQTVAEIGTGSGAIICVLARQFPSNHYLATEISQEAIDLAQENAKRLELNGVIIFFVGDLAQPLRERYAKRINLLVANLPYIPSGLLTNLDPTIRYHEPNIALDGGEDGLELYRRFLPQAKDLLSPGGVLLCEHEFDQGDAMRHLTQAVFPKAQIETLKDYLGHDRVMHCQIQ